MNFALPPFCLDLSHRFPTLELFGDAISSDRPLTMPREQVAEGEAADPYLSKGARESGGDRVGRAAVSRTARIASSKKPLSAQ